jgi:hypothetical protein
MSSSYSVSFSSRLLLIVVGLAILIGGVLFVLPASALRYVGIYYAVVGVFNLFILPLFCALRNSRFDLATLRVGDLASTGYAAS